MKEVDIAFINFSDKPYCQLGRCEEVAVKKAHLTGLQAYCAMETGGFVLVEIEGCSFIDLCAICAKQLELSVRAKSEHNKFIEWIEKDEEATSR